jgi:putative transposase
LKEFNGERDHVHLLLIYPPKVRFSEPVNSLKGVSSRRLQLEFPAISTFWSVRKSAGALFGSRSRTKGALNPCPVALSGRSRSPGVSGNTPGPSGVDQSAVMTALTSV